MCVFLLDQHARSKACWISVPPLIQANLDAAFCDSNWATNQQQAEQSWPMAITSKKYTSNISKPLIPILYFLTLVESFVPFKVPRLQDRIGCCWLCGVALCSHRYMNTSFMFGRNWSWSCLNRSLMVIHWFITTLSMLAMHLRPALLGMFVLSFHLLEILLCVSIFSPYP